MGLGALGSNLLMQLIHIDPKAEFVGIDYDKVEDRNIPTQAYLLPHIGMHKAQAMQIIIGMKSNNIKYRCKIKKIKYEYDTVIMDYKDLQDVLIIDCFDNSESRRLLEGIDNCLHIGFSPQYTAEIIWGKDYTTPNDIPEDQNDICDMDQAIPFINYIVSLAGLVIKEYLDTGKKNNFAIVDKFKIRRL
jgi:hypothetical protein